MLLPKRCVAYLCLFSLLAWSSVAQAEHGLALGNTPKYPANFSHFAYVNPDAPKTGSITFAGIGSFDSLNPYLLKGIAAEGMGLMFDTLMAYSMDESFSMYGLVASEVSLATDQRAVTFKINPAARFSDGTPIKAADVKFSFDTLLSAQAHPQYRVYWADVQGCEVLDEYQVRFQFKRVNRELHMILGQLPLFSKAWLNGQAFDKTTMQTPVASGPYLLDRYDLGKNIVYKRNPNYWAKDLNVRRGQYNFDQVQYKYYKDPTIALEALKAGEFDFMDVYSSKQWARDLDGPKFKPGKLVKEVLTHQNNAGMQGFVFNLRKPSFQDLRVRKAINLAFDFEWTNQNLFFNQYQRCDSYFSNSPLAAHGLPTGAELMLLAKFREQLPSAVFSTPWQAVTTKAPNNLRDNLRQAKQLLTEADWHLPEGKQILENAAGASLQFEIMLQDSSFERIMAPFARNLEKLGIRANYRVVDQALYKQRQDSFDYDMIVASFAQSQSPGNEQIGYWHSKSAEQSGSYNLIGLKTPVIDALVDKLVSAEDYSALQAAARALDRVLLHGEYVVPNWYISGHRVVYWDKFAKPTTPPLYYPTGASLVLNAWWANPTPAKP